jgi:hypothetical protein
MDDMYITVKIRKEIFKEKTKYYLDFKEIASKYLKTHKEIFDEYEYFNSKSWSPKDGYHLLGYAEKKINHLGETEDFKKQLRAKEKRVYDVKDYMDYYKTRYENPNLKYLKKEW